jgi:uncharacterized phiE125 gp8 family phage protein
MSKLLRMYLTRFQTPLTPALRLTRTSDPANDPVSLADAKNHLRVDISDDDTLISALITAAREHVEEATRRALITQTWRLSLDQFPADDEIELPRPPLQSVSSIIYTDKDDTTSTLATSVYEVDTDGQPGRVKLAYGEDWPSDTLAETNPVKITFVAGYGDNASDVPQRWQQAILLLVGHWYENREAIVTGGGIPKELPLAVQSLIQMDRIY